MVIFFNFFFLVGIESLVVGDRGDGHRRPVATVAGDPNFDENTHGLVSDQLRTKLHCDRSENCISFDQGRNFDSGPDA